MKTKILIKKSGLPLCLCLLLALSLWAPARADSGKEYEAILDATLLKLREVITDPEHGSVGGEWAVLTLARGGLEDDSWYGKYLDKLLNAVDQCGGVMDDVKYTEYSRVVLALSSIGLDATKLNTGSQVYDLVSPLLTKQDNGKYWASKQGNTGTAFAIIALDTQNYFDNDAGKQARADLLDTLLKNQNTDGGWSINGGASGIDPTAMALQALAPYYLNQKKFEGLGASHTYKELQSSVSKGLDCLNTMDGLSDGKAKDNDYDSVEAAAQVVVALAALDRDAANDPLLGDALASVLAYYDGNGAFYHDKKGSSANSQMSHEQAAYALVAYARWSSGKNSLYDMTDRKMVSEISVTAPSSVTVKQTASGCFSITSSNPCVAVVQNADGSCSCLTAEGSGDTRSFHTVHGSVTVLLRGDANGDGRFNVSDIVFAKGALLGKNKLDPICWFAADATGDQRFNVSDIIRAKGALLKKSNMNW